MNTNPDVLRILAEDHIRELRRSAGRARRTRPLFGRRHRAGSPEFVIGEAPDDDVVAVPDDTDCLSGVC